MLKSFRHLDFEISTKNCDTTVTYKGVIKNGYEEINGIKYIRPEKKVQKT